MKLKTTQKNLLFEWISNSKVGASLYKYVEDEDFQRGISSVTIYVKSSDFQFEIQEGTHGRYYLSFSPGYQSISEQYSAENWNDVVSEFIQWIGRVDEELIAVDRWGEFEKLLNDTTLDNKNIDNDAFTVPEYLEVKDKLEEFKGGISLIGLNENQLFLLNGKIDMVLDQTKNLGKFDWRSLFVGTIMSIILQLSLSQEQGREIWGLIKRIFSSYFLQY